MTEASIASAHKSRRGLTVIFGLILVAVALLLGLLFYGLQQRNAPPLGSGPAPTFELTTFDGARISSASFRGKPVVVNFWASWCIPCRDEAAALQDAWEKYHAQGLVVLGVDYVDTDPEAKKFIAEFKQTYPNGADLGTRISQDYRITGVPETFFITRDGQLLAGTDAKGQLNGHIIGPVSPDQLTARIGQLLKQ